MKKLIVIGVLIFCGYKLYQLTPKSEEAGPLDADGNPVLQVFVGPNCGKYCDDVEGLLVSRNVEYQLIDVSTPEGEKYNIRQYPYTRLGKRKVMGNANMQIVSMLAESYGDSVLTPAERIATRDHFDADGNPVVVLYGTKWCQYCARERAYLAENGVRYLDVDVEISSTGKFSYNALKGNGYPLVYVGYRRFEGYMEQEILNAVANM